MDHRARRKGPNSDDRDERSNEHAFHLSLGEYDYFVEMSDEARDCIKQQAVVFKETRATRTAVSDDNDSNIDVADQQITRFELFLTFIDYVSNIYRGETNCHDLVSHRSFAAELLAVFDRNFVQAHDIHGQVQTMAMSESRSSALRHYYDASAFAERHPKVEIEQIFKTLRDQRRVFAYFGGQGSDNPECLNNLRKLYDRYRPLLHDLFQAANTLLHELSTDSYSTAFFNSDNIRLTEWLDNPSTAPDTRKLSLAPYSFPLIGLASLANYCVLCKAANLSPGDVRGMLKGVTGHSQGIIIAAAVSAAYDWESFYDSAKFALELLFWIGLESHREAPQNKLSSKIMKETISAGFGEPSCMLSVRGLKKASLLMELSAVDAELGSAENVELALENTSDSFVLAGPAAILRAVALRLERLSASPGLDQSRVPYDQRRKEIYLQFMPISAPFHSSYLKHVPDRVFQRMQDSRFKLGELKVPVYGTSNGQNLKSGGTDIIEALVSMITTEAVNWPLATTFLGATHILDLGPGRLHSLMSSVKEGTGARLFAAGGGQSAEVGSLADAFGHGGATSLSSWSEKHGPRLRRKESVESVDTSFSRLLGVPPIMVAGMTPTTVSWRFVSAISTAGYHAELAGGGYFSPDAFENAILRLSDCLSGSRGITVNLIYVNPRAMAWQVALLKDLISQGVPIEGMTIGAGVPSLDVACDYIDTIGLKHIGFKPGSKSAIQQVISIAKARPRFPILLQWTGGRGGGHHSFEDFHEPILQLYGSIRRCDNIVLVAGSGFGDAEDAYPYLTGSWSGKFNRTEMPFDAILLGSRMMIAREAETSFEVKKLIAETPGCADADWTRSYQQDVGGVITVTSEMGQPIHKIANRGVRLWAELDKTVFSLSATDRIKALKTKSSYIKDRLCKDYQKPWFATIDDRMVELEEMSYMQVIQRMVELMYVSHQHRWIDATYKRSTYDFICQALSRFTDQSINLEVLDQPGIFLERLASLVPELSKNMVSPQDVLFFLHLCKTPGRKPVNFVPRLNEDFEYFFKKDSLWQAEDLDAVVGRDAGRVCILQGPVAARYSTSADQSTEEILQNINKGFINRLRRDGLVGQDEQVSFRVNWEHVEACHCVCTSMDVNEDNIDVWFPSSKDLPDDAPWMDFLKSFSPPWLIALLTSSAIARGSRRTKNNIPRLFAARQGQRFLFRGLENNAITTVSIEKDDRSGQDRQELLLLSWDASQHYQITLKLFEHLTTNGQPAILTFRFRYDDSNLTCPISERVKDRNLSTKKFYGQLWASNNPSHIITDDAAFLEFIGKETRLTEGTLSRFVSCIDPKLAFGRNSHLPMDFGIVIAWDVLVQPLLLPAIDGDLLRLVHLSNEFRQFPNVAPLQVGDTVKAISHITAVQIQEPGKIVEVTALIKKSNIPILEIKSSFLFQGRYTDFDRTFRLIQNPSYVLDVKNKTIEALLRDREWFVPDSIDEALLGSKLHFETTTKVRYADKSTYAAIETSGTILKLDQNGELDKIGSVLFAEGQCTGNPVVEFLERHGRPCGSQIEFQSAVPLGEGAELVFTAPASNNSYSKFSGDFNPIHVSPLFAAYADLPGTITHGMFTSARVRQLVREQIFGADEDLFRRYSVSFTGMVLPGDAIEVQVLHTAMLDGQKVLKITATHGITGETVLKAEAEVEEKQSAYLFTGQGSQAPDMGMDLYATSEICRSLWDRADTHTHKTFGWSLIDVVKKNPQSLTIYFGGTRGRTLRDTYLKMRTEQVHPDGTMTSEPILKDLKPNADSYTFSHPQGLLFSTQFAQPALTVMETATFADLRAKGLVQDSAIFAGHSLGEYGALAAVAEFMPIESLAEVSFYRGLTMQASMKRDAEGRTEFSMMAVNPSRVCKGFSAEALNSVVKTIAHTSGLLLEIVNHNVEGQQYVCAGHIRTLDALSKILHYISKSPSQFTSFTDPTKLSHLHTTTTTVLSQTSTTSISSIELTRTAATVPLSGIDVPFHSSKLLPGVSPFRRFLLQNVKLENVDPDRLEHKFIPNLTGKPFELSREYIKDVQEMTGSHVLEEILGQWDDVWAPAVQRAPITV